MTIKVPDQVVFYSERDHEVEMLLCWIPPSKFDEVAVNQEAAKRLRQNYPKGVELRIEPKELEAEGIKLDVSPDDLAKTYKALRDRNALHESGMIIGQALQHRAEALQPDISADDRISELPEMVGDEEPVMAFRRLSVRQLRPPE
jgi:hypothetical protein